MGKTVRYGVDAKKKYNDGKVGRNRHIPKEWAYTKKDKTPVVEEAEEDELFYAYLEEISNF